MIDESMYTLLAAFGTVSPDIAPDNTAPPYIIFSRTVTVPGNHLDNSEPLEQITFTIDVHHTTKKAARTLAESIKAALRVASFGGYVVADRDIYENEVRLYRIGIDFEVFA